MSSDAAFPATLDAKLHLHVKLMSGDALLVEVPCEATVGDLKHAIHAQCVEYVIPWQRLTVIHAECGSVAACNMHDATSGFTQLQRHDRTLASYGVVAETPVNLVIVAHGCQGEFVRHVIGGGVPVNNCRGLAVNADGEVVCVCGPDIVVCNAEGVRLRSFEHGRCSDKNIALTASGDILISDTGAECVKQISSTDGTLVRSFGVDDGPGKLHSPHGIAVCATSGDVYIVDTSSSAPGLVMVFARDGTFLRTIGKRVGTSPRTEDVCADPFGIALSANGDVFVSDQGGGSGVRMWTRDGVFVRQVGAASAVEADPDAAAAADDDDDAGKLQMPLGIAIAGDELFVGDFPSRAIVVFDAASGAFRRRWLLRGGKAAKLGMFYVAVGPDGGVFASTGSGGRVEQYR